MGRRKKYDVPTHNKMLIPIIEALKVLGGSGSIEEINETVYEIMSLDEQTLSVPHNEAGVQSKVEYRLAWARTYLKKYGLIENSSRGIWSLIDSEINTTQLDSEKIVRFVRENTLKIPKADTNSNSNNYSQDEQIEDEVEIELGWKERLILVLLKIAPSTFERLCQRVLRESGFIQVEVKGKSGDGGIDGKGIARINGFLSFHVFFQCKRYKGSVGSGDIRDFRGAMQGRADKGLFITTGNFTREGVKEATRDGAPPIDLIDGDLFCEKLREFNLGVRTELIEKITVNSDWLNKI